MALKGSCDAKMRRHMNPRLKYYVVFVEIDRPQGNKVLHNFVNGKKWPSHGFLGGFSINTFGGIRYNIYI